MELLNKYFDIQNQIFDYFGYVEDWRAIPIEDRTNMYWYLDQEKDGSGCVYYSDDVEKFDGNHFCDTIYAQRFLPKWVYVGKDYTMVCVDTHTDGNKFLAIYTNKMRLNDCPVSNEWRYK